MLRLTAALFWLDGGVCSQNPAHSFWLAGRPLPLCARDLGLFGGFLLAFAALSLHGRRTWRPLWLLGLLPLTVDGLASFAALEPSNNALRLATGLLAGVSLAALLVPLLPPAKPLVCLPALAIPAAVLAAAMGHPWLALALVGTAGALTLGAIANRLAHLPWAASAALALPELVVLAAAKHLALVALG